MQPVQDVEPLLDVVQLCLAEAQRVDLLGDLLGAVAHAVHEVGHRLLKRSKLVVDPREPRQRALRLSQQGRRAVGLTVSVEAGRRLVQAVGELLGVLHQLAPRLQLLLLAGAQMRLRQLVDLILQRLHAPQLLALVHGEPVDLAPQRPHGLIALGIGRALGLVLGKAVENGQMLRLVKQRSAVVLAVDVDELHAELLQHADRHGRAVHAAEILAVGGQLAPDVRLGVVGHTVLGEPRQLRHAVKNRADGRPARSGSDHVAIGAFAQNGRNRVDDDRFACAGLAGHDVEAVLEDDLGLFDDGDVFNMQQPKHNAPPSGNGRSGSVEHFVDLRAEFRSGGVVAHDDQRRIVAGERADHVGHMQRVDVRAGRRTQAGHGLDDDQVLRKVDIRDAFAEDHAEAAVKAVDVVGLRRGIVIAAQTVECFDDAQLLDVARNGRLRAAEAAGVQLVEQLLLRFNVFFCDQLQNFRLTVRFHEETSRFI